MGQCLNNGQPNVVNTATDTTNKETAKEEGDKKVYGDNGVNEQNDTIKVEAQTNKETKTDANDTNKEETPKEEKETKQKEEETIQPKPKEEDMKEKAAEDKKESEQETKQKEQSQQETEEVKQEPTSETKPKPKPETQSTVIIGSNVKMGGHVQIGTSGNTTVLINNKPVNALTNVDKEAKESNVQIGDNVVIAPSTAVTSTLPTKNDVEISRHIACIDSSKTYSGYPIDNIYKTGSDYWCSEDANDVYLIFDAKHAKVSKWDMVMAYDCGGVTFLTANDKNGSYKEIASGKPSESIDLKCMNERYIKLEFSGVDNSYVGITGLAIHGDGVGVDDDEKENGDDNDNEMKDENEDEFEADDTAIDLSTNPDIKCISSYPVIDDFKSKIPKMYDTQPYNFLDMYEMDATKEAWLKFKIFYLKSQHQRYIKIAFDERITSGFVGINKLKWTGFQAKEDLKGLITDKIKIYQCSGKLDLAKAVFKNNMDTWKADIDETTWIIFDCMRYELNKIVITFKAQSVPQFVTLKRSDVAPRYAFDDIDAKATKKYTLNSTQSWNEKDWIDIPLTQEITVSSNAYDDIGFKRYVMLEFSKYMIQAIEIQKIEFFGILSQRISDDDEQFQIKFDGDGTENKEEKDDTAPYKPDFIDSSPSMQATSMPLDNIWKEEDHSFWMAQYGIDPYLIIDLGNNESKLEEILVKAYPSYVYKTLKMSTSDKWKSKQWDLLVQDDEMESKMQEGGRYDLTVFTVKKYIKLEFFELKMQMFACSCIKLYGDSTFLIKDEKVVTLDDIKTMPYKDLDLIQSVKDQMQKDMTAKFASLGSQIALVEQDPNKGKLCEEWKRLKLEWFEATTAAWYEHTPIAAYSADSVYEQELILGITGKQKEMAHQCCTEQVENEMKWAEQEVILKEEEKKAQAQWMESLEDLSISHKSKFKLQKVYEEKRSIASDAMMQYWEEYRQHQAAYMEKVYDLFQDPKAKLVYETWKEAIINTPRQLSSTFTVKEYESALGQYATRNDKDGLKQVYGILADLFDDSIAQKKELLHKFFVYQLNHMYNYQSYARSASYGIPPVTILFDVDELDGKIAHIDFKCSQIGTNKIVISTSDVLMEQKVDDDDETVMNYSNFNVIAQLQFNDDIRKKKKDGGVGYQDTRIYLDYKNKRYIKVDFDDWDVAETSFTINIERVKIYAKNEEFDVLDDDMDPKEGKCMDKYKLKLVKDNKQEFNERSMDDAYTLDAGNYYETQHQEMKPYFIFDCESRKVDKFEIGFDDTSWRRFDEIKISTTDDYEPSTTIDVTDDDDEWKVIFKEKDAFDSYILKDNAPVKTVEINGENARYLRISFDLSKDSNQLEILKLKFYTTDPAEYKWDIDENIKNLTSKVKILRANKASASQIADNMLKDNYGQSYSTSVNSRNHKEQIEDKIRDEVCRAVNLLRKSRGGKISKHQKHFVKFLLCFQNKRNYDEMLYSAKLVMGLLRKPLDIEYARLESMHSPILTLALDKEYKCSDKIKSIHQLLSFDYSTWYIPRNALFWPNDLAPLSDEWSAMGLVLNDPEFKQIRRSALLDENKSFVTSDDLAMEYLNLICAKLDASFQARMRELFKENREKLNLKYPSGDVDIAVQSGPVKTKARQKIKIDLKYFKKEAPQCMAVLDIVRCGIVCEDDVELCSLFQLIMERFKGDILRVKNAFDDVKKGDDSHGYRAVMVNINFGDDSVINKKGIKVVCEAQLLLNKYYQVRKDMHLGYGICRSQDGGISENTAPYVVLSRDCAKYGKVDI